MKSLRKAYFYDEKKLEKNKDKSSKAP